MIDYRFPFVFLRGLDPRQGASRGGRIDLCWPTPKRRDVSHTPHEIHEKSPQFAEKIHTLKSSHTNGFGLW